MRTHLSLLGLLLAATPAAADTFRPAMDSRGFVTLDSSTTLDRFDLSFGIVTSWGSRALTFDATGRTANTASDVITPTLQAALGLGRLEIGAAVPFRIIGGDSNTTAQGVGDFALHAKLQIVDPRRHSLGLALTTTALLPTGSAADRLVDEGETTIVPGVVVERDWGERARVAVNLGWMARPTRTFMTGDMTPVTSSAAVAFGVAGALAVSPGHFDLVAEITTEVPTVAAADAAVDALAGAKLYLGRNSYFTLGAGAGLAARGVTTPVPRAFVGIVFEPKPAIGDAGKMRDLDDKPYRVAKADRPDRDGDGIPDDVDKCPDEPEDFDGFQDADGCPDPDNDGDGIPDYADSCPNEPETVNGYEDEDGCPDRNPVKLGHSGIEILEQVHFETDRAEIKPDSFHLLNAVAKTINDNPTITLIEVQGHADERGSHDHNMKLTQARAEAVREYLIAHSVPADHLTAKGYGETKPLEKAHSEAAWAVNRRVEFVILRQTAPQS